MTPEEIADVAARHDTAMADAMLVACAEAGVKVPPRRRREPFVITGDEWDEYQRRVTEGR